METTKEINVYLLFLFEPAMNSPWLFVLPSIMLQLSSCQYVDENSFRVGAFNVRVFGATKMQRNVTKDLIKIILRYDIVLIQEIRDVEGKAIQVLFNAVKREAAKTMKGVKLEMVLSPRLGRTTSKEEYAFIYRKDKVQLKDSYTYSDPLDRFEREPFIVRFSSSITAIKDFAVVAIHAAPRDAANEISNLTNVYDDVISKYKIKDVIIMGDFNAGCDYIRDWKNVRLATDPRFYWLIDNSFDTTSEHSDCPYDRIVVAGESLLDKIIPESPGVFRYDEELGLTREQALLVSDHYPVECQLLLGEENEQTVSKKFLTISDERVNQRLLNNARKIYQMRLEAVDMKHYQVRNKFTRSGAYLDVTVSSKASTLRDACIILNSMEKEFPDFISKSQTAAAKRYFQKISHHNDKGNGHGRYQTLRDFYKDKKEVYSISLTCDLQDRSKGRCILKLGFWNK